jgi:hypothetical protein
MAADTALHNAPAVASSPAILTAFRFSYWQRRGDYRSFEVVAAGYSEACTAACVASRNNDNLHSNGYRHELPGVISHALRGFVLDINEQNLLLHFPIDPRD